LREFNLAIESMFCVLF